MQPRLADILHKANTKQQDKIRREKRFEAALSRHNQRLEAMREEKKNVGGKIIPAASATKMAVHRWIKSVGVTQEAPKLKKKKLSTKVKQKVEERMSSAQGLLVDRMQHVRDALQAAKPEKRLDVFDKPRGSFLTSAKHLSSYDAKGPVAWMRPKSAPPLDGKKGEKQRKKDKDTPKSFFCSGNEHRARTSCALGPLRHDIAEIHTQRSRADSWQKGPTALCGKVMPSSNCWS
ncbi:hypothetical protein CYMTET_40639 [Cymbomonas tetramitiformis]|uniref:Uncharacterized protein n=1 Tax=Cymbomonas tetramitiformis TaxID=36881 RepID=A0AAE0C7N8_9CHLO|nr:hypothetical protein CYMTET_40639 [Cymbomonas tetramitiformis]